MSQTQLDIEMLPARSDLHVARKLWHIGTGALGLYCYYTLNLPLKNWIIAMLGFGIAMTFMDLFRLKSRIVGQTAIRLFGPFMRLEETEKMSGLPFYALGVGLSLFLYEEKIALLSIMFLVFSDPLTSFFGVKFGKDKILPNKSLQGSLAGFVVCYFISLIYGISFGETGLDLLAFSLLAGIIGAASELLSVFNVDDNLAIPVVSGLGLTILNFFFHLY